MKTKFSNKLIRLISVIITLTILSTAGIVNVYADYSNDSLTITTGTDPKLFEAYSNGNWIDLLTPELTDSNGNVAYCLEHRKDSPSGTYTPFEKNSLLSSKTIAGLMILLEYGYPYDNGGISNSAARYATANAIRSWLAESEGIGYINMMKPENVRPKNGNQNAYNLYLSLLEKARSGNSPKHSVACSPSSVKLDLEGDNLKGTTKIIFNDLNGKYYLDLSKLPAGVSVNGYTGSNGDTLTFTVSKDLAGQDININNLFNGTDTRTPDNIHWYEPSKDSLQHVVIIDNHTYTTSSLCGITLTSDELKGNLLLQKLAEDNVLSDIQFKITGNGLDKTFSTDSQGKILINNINAGIYTISEINTPERYIPPSSQQITVLSGETVSVTFNNILVKGYVEVTKTDENTSTHLLNGAVFGIYRSIDNVKLGELITDRNGTGKSSLLVYGDYYLKEITAPDGYFKNDIKYPFTINTEGEIIKLDISNKPQTAKISIIKKDLYSGITPQGDSSLYGAIFEILDSSKNLIETVSCTSHSNKVTSSNLQLGKYYIREKTAPVGYVISHDLIEVNLSYSNQDTEINYIDQTFYNKVIEGKISIIKFGNKKLNIASSSSEIKPPLDDVEFTIKLKSTGKTVDTIITDKNGYAESILLPFGTYIVSETKGKDGYKFIKDFEVFIDTDGKIYNYIIQDEVYESHVKIIKKDSDTKETIPVSGIAFEIYDNNMNLITQTIVYPTLQNISKFETAHDGTLILPQTLTYGHYYLKEVSAPEGYSLFEDYIPFTIDDSGSSMIEVICENKLIKGSFKLIKIDKDNSEQYLKGAVYNIWGVDSYNSNYNVIIETNESGEINIDDLLYGRYKYKEVTAPLGFTLSEVEGSFNISQDGEIITKIEENKKITGKAKIIKVDADTLYPMYGVKFGLFTIDGTEIKTAFTDSNGNIEFSDIVYGKYYIKELEAPDGYILNDEIYYFDINKSDDVFIVTVMNRKIELFENNIPLMPSTGDDKNIFQSTFMLILSASLIITNLPKRSIFKI